MKDGKKKIYLTKQQASLIQTKDELYVRYPQLSKRKEPIISLYDAVKETKQSLVMLDKSIGENVSLQWLKVQLIEFFSYMGAFEQVSEYQIVTLARHIRHKFYYLTLAELTYFFEAFADGSYGTMYVGKHINPQNMMEALSQYENDVLIERGRVEDEEKNQRLSEILKKEKENKEKGITGYAAWLRYCKNSNRPSTDFPSFKCKNINHK